MIQPRQLQLFGLQDFPQVTAGDDLAKQIIDCLKANDLVLENGDIVVVAQKIVSKSEARSVALSSVIPGERAKTLAAKTGKDARLVELILSESVAIVRTRAELIIVEHRNGFVHATAGIDFSNMPQTEGDEIALLLPENPDKSARDLRNAIQQRIGCNTGVIISDSMGRAWRNGIVGQAIGCAGVKSVWSRIGDSDLYGRTLETTEVGVADELAAAASLLMGQGAEGVPVVIIRGAGVYLGDEHASAQDLIRDPATDLFRDW